MIKEALQYLIDDLAPVKREVINGGEYSSRYLHRINAPTISSIETNFLHSVADYINNNCDGCREDGLIIHIVSEIQVEVFDHANQDCTRNYFMVCTAPVRPFGFGQFYDPDEFNIALQSRFVQGADTEYLLRIAGNVRNEAVKTVSDDGVSQQVTLKNGIASISSEVLKNRVHLAPFRTFTETDQPESEFIFRMMDGPRMGLFEADGGAWKQEAVEKIYQYLLREISAEALKSITILR